MSTLKTNKDSLERIFASLKSGASNKVHSEMYLNEQIEYASAIFNNEISANAVSELLAKRQINEEIYKHILFWFFYGKETEKKQKIRNHDHNFWKDADIIWDFTLIQRLHFKILEILDKYNEKEKPIFLYNPATRIGKLNIPGFETIEFKGDRAEVLDFFYRRRGENEWFSYTDGLQRFGASDLEKMVKAINERVNKETNNGFEKPINIKEKPKNNPRKKGEYMWGLS